MKVDRLFLLTSVVYLFVGMILGNFMGRTGDHSQMPTHAHIMMLGFVSMSIFAVIYHLWPAMQDTVLAKIHFGLHQLGTLSMIILLYNTTGGLGDTSALGPFFGMTDFTLMGATLVFTWNVFKFGAVTPE